MVFPITFAPGIVARWLRTRGGRRRARSLGRRLRGLWLGLRPLLGLRELRLGLRPLLRLRELFLGLRPLLRLREFRAQSRRLLWRICRCPGRHALRTLRRSRVSIRGGSVITRIRLGRGTVCGLCA